MGIEIVGIMVVGSIIGWFAREKFCLYKANKKHWGFDKDNHLKNNDHFRQMWSEMVKK